MIKKEKEHNRKLQDKFKDLNFFNIHLIFFAFNYLFELFNFPEISSAGLDRLDVLRKYICTFMHIKLFYIANFRFWFYFLT